LAGFLIATFAVAVIAVLSYTTLQSTTSSATALLRVIETMAQLQAVVSTLKDAETGQRGYLLTGRESYLEPFTNARGALPGEIGALHRLLDDDPEQRKRLAELAVLAGDKMKELEETVALGRAGRTDEALELVRTDRGKNLMDGIRSQIDDMLTSERRMVVARTDQWQSAATVSFAVTGGGSAILIFLVAVAALVASRDHRARHLESWLRSGQLGLSELMQGDQGLEELGGAIIGFLAGYLDAQVGAMLIAEGGHFRRIGGFALPAAAGAELIRPGDGLTGQAVRAERPLRVRDVPAGYLPIASSTGRGEPGELLIAPARVDGTVQAVVELGFFGAAAAAKERLLERVSDAIAVAVRASKDRTRLEELLQETQQQSRELQTREEELRVNNEELEEQGRSLRESRAQLESQQAELEQINSQLEEQTQTLEQQKDELARSHAVLLEKTADLQRANEYKSEFLANMSHELRTPLNSTLILAKLLADNKEGNLTDGQVKYAQTISSAGNDLLNLINDVLDLSRIEAGKVDVAPETVQVSRILDSLARTFEPAAEQKKLGFSTFVEAGAPAQIETDPQRLGQILRNLLSNAIKFTERGQVSVRVAAPAEDAIEFTVKDSGVGIPANQQQVIFEAFRQADGSIHRKYGGTGLGLSISRDLAHLLGGRIVVRSSPGEGSVFSLTLPRSYQARAPLATPVAPSVPSLPPRVEAPAPPPYPVIAAIEDDRSKLPASARLILVIEDDVSFAVILRDLVRELGFLCVVAQSGGDGLAAARRFRPGGILLDINLPDHSGLSVLDQLKRDPRTRHIPVHVASVADYRREALELGAVGYALKPAKRDELIGALNLLEVKSSQSTRHVLVVEDDRRQRESICDLLGSDDVLITAVENAAAALDALTRTTYDCMVMDINLPDYSGYALLERMAEREEVSFPPVIVYTGRALSAAEEQRLRRHSKSIIIKDARSPERLLDEVSLFLHQIESKLPPERQQMLRAARDRDASLDGRRILVVEDDVRNIFALSSVLEPKGATVEIARNGREAITLLTAGAEAGGAPIDLVLMDIMMPEMDGLTATREIRRHPRWKNLPIIALTAKAMRDDQEKCLAAGANDYMAKPLDVERLLSLVRVWMPR